MAKKTTIRNRKIVDGHQEPSVIEIIDDKGNRIHVEAEFPYEVRENESSWVAYSPHFKTFGYSNKSESDAAEELKCAIDVFFQVHRKRGTLEKALLKFGWFKINNALQQQKLFNTPVKKGSIRKDLNLRDFTLAVA
jgi:hypothetical protein